MRDITYNRYHSKEERQALKTEWQNSGLGKKEFCAAKQLNYNTFISWFAGQDKTKSTGKGFVPVKIETGTSGIFAEIELARGRKIVFHQTVSLEVLQAILKC